MFNNRFKNLLICDPKEVEVSTNAPKAAIMFPISSKTLKSLKNKKAYSTSPMSGEEMVRLCKEHTMFSWSAQGKVVPIPMVKAEGVHFWDAQGI